jgi:hypothetical protein
MLSDKENSFPFYFGGKYVRRQEKYFRILPNYDNILTFEMNVISSMQWRHS